MLLSCVSQPGILAQVAPDGGLLQRLQPTLRIPLQPPGPLGLGQEQQRQDGQRDQHHLASRSVTGPIVCLLLESFRAIAQCLQALGLTPKGVNPNAWMELDGVLVTKKSQAFTSILHPSVVMILTAFLVVKRKGSDFICIACIWVKCGF